jgi:hypothetical protein
VLERSIIILHFEIATEVLYKEKFFNRALSMEHNRALVEENEEIEFKGKNHMCYLD